MSHPLDGQITDLTALLRAARCGDKAALDDLFSLMYAELHQLAHIRLSRNERTPQLDTTSLVHESYLRCVKAGQLAVGTTSGLISGDRVHSDWCERLSLQFGRSR